MVVLDGLASLDEQIEPFLGREIVLMATLVRVPRTCRRRIANSCILSVWDALQTTAVQR